MTQEEFNTLKVGDRIRSRLPDNRYHALGIVTLTSRNLMPSYSYTDRYSYSFKDGRAESPEYWERAQPLISQRLEELKNA